MKKISFLIGSLGGGGAERVTVALADYFCESGYEVFFIVFSKANNSYRINPKIKIDYLPENTGKCAIFLRIKELKKLLKNQAPDYVISLGLGYQYLILGNLLNKYKFILSERNAPQYYYNWYQKIYVKYSYEKAYRVVFQTEDAKQYYGKMCIRDRLLRQEAVLPVSDLFAHRQIQVCFEDERGQPWLLHRVGPYR